MVLCVAARVYYQDEIQLNYIGKYCISLVIVQPNRYTLITRKIKDSVVERVFTHQAQTKNRYI